ncbi:MAG: CotH kinase family protein [Bacteroidia bacterium]
MSRKLFLNLLILCLALCRGLVSAQNINPDKDLVFDPNLVAEIRITMDEGEKQWLLDQDNAQNNDYLKCDLNFRNANINETRYDVGIRIRGNTSRSHPKKSFKIKFTEWQGQKFFNHKKFNLKATNNDPTLIREHMSLAVFRRSNVPAARSHHCRLYINDEFMGVYTNVEQIDDEFLDTRFGTENGNLYKCNWGANLDNSNDPYNQSLFELENNRDVNDRGVLENFIDVLNNTSDANFKAEIEKVLNVENALRFLAVEAILGHWDGYSYNKNNFYIHENPTTKKVNFIAYDVDNTFGINWIPNDWANRDLRAWAIENDKRPLYNRLLNVPDFNKRYLEICKEVIEKYFNEDVLFWEIENTRDRIKKYVAQDSYFGLTFGFSYDDFLDAYTEEVVQHCPYGIMPYITQRVESAIEQIPTISSISSVYNNLSIIYLGDGLFYTGNSKYYETLSAVNMNGQMVALTWLGLSTFYLEPKHRIVIISGEKAFKKVLMH